MVQRIGGLRRKSRQKFKKYYRAKGKVSVRRYLQNFTANDKVVLAAEPAIQKGMYMARFHGRTGKIIGKQGECYKVHVKDGSKEKMLLVHPIHLKRL